MGGELTQEHADFIVTTEANKRIRQLEELNRVLSAEVDAQRQREHALSNAYLRLRRLIGRRAFDTPHGPTGEQVWEVTETALRELVNDADAMRTIVAHASSMFTCPDCSVEKMSAGHLMSLRDVVIAYESSNPK